jgi:hypothetical protein
MNPWLQKGKEVEKMVRTCAWMIGLVVVCGSVCTAQELNMDLVGVNLGGFNFVGMNPLGDFASVSILPGVDSSAPLEESLGGVQDMLTIFEASSGASGVPTTMLPGWGSLPDVTQMQTGMGVQQPTEIQSFVGGVGDLPDYAGQGTTTTMTLPTFPLTMGSFGAFDISAFSSLQMN